MRALFKSTDNTRARRWRRMALLPAIVLVVTVGYFLLQLRTGIQVVVVNAGNRTIDAVVLHVGATTHSLGDIAPGKSVEATVHPPAGAPANSRVELELKGPDGKSHRLAIASAIEPRKRGVIRVSVKDGRIAKIEHEIHVQ